MVVFDESERNQVTTAAQNFWFSPFFQTTFCYSVPIYVWIYENSAEEL